MGPDDDRRLPDRDRLDGRRPVARRRERARQQLDGDAERPRAARRGSEVLAGEQVGRREERALEPGRARPPRAHRPRPRSCPSRRRPGGGGASASAAARSPRIASIAVVLVVGQLDVAPELATASASASGGAERGVRGVVDGDRPAPRRGRAAGAARPCRSGAPAARRTRAGGARRRGPRTSPGSGPPRAPSAMPASASPRRGSGRAGTPGRRGRRGRAPRGSPIRRRARGQAGRQPVDRHDPPDVEQLVVVARPAGSPGCRASASGRSA